MKLTRLMGKWIGFWYSVISYALMGLLVWGAQLVQGW